MCSSSPKMPEPLPPPPPPEEKKVELSDDLRKTKKKKREQTGTTSLQIPLAMGGTSKVGTGLGIK